MIDLTSADPKDGVGNELEGLYVLAGLLKCADSGLIARGDIQRTGFLMARLLDEMKAGLCRLGEAIQEGTYGAE